jgi:hypothetical protein
VKEIYFLQPIVLVMKFQFKLASLFTRSQAQANFLIIIMIIKEVQDSISIFPTTMVIKRQE